MLSSGQDFGKKFLDSKHVLKVYLKPSRKNQKILFLPLSSVLVWLRILHLSEGFWAGPAMSKVVKIKILDFSYWASSTPWGHVLSLKTFCWNPVLSWAIRYSVFQKVKFTSSFKFVCRTIFSTFWHLVVKFGYNNWFLSNKKSGFFPFRWIIGEIKKSLFQFFQKKIFDNFFELEM